MHIVSLEAENFKRLKAVRIDPDTNTVVIAGRNAQGKSSVLDAIQSALAGKAGAKKTSRPIRDGESKARVVITLDDLVVERKWTPSGSTLTVSPREGNAKLNSPQAVLDNLIGNLSFDPLEFAESEPRKQVETLIDLIGRKTFEELAELRKAAYDERTEVNRDLKRVQAQYDALGTPEPAERVDLIAKVALLQQAHRKQGLRRDWERLEEQIQLLRRNQEAIAAEAADLPDVDVDTLQAEIEQAEELNDRVDAYESWKELGTQVEDNRHASESLTKRIEEIDANRAKLISDADLPVEGLTFDDDGVQYHDIPFEQASAAERLKVSVAMAMALNPDLKVICIRDASLLDDESKLALIKMAKAHDYQIWYEVVASHVDESVGVLIEDGEVL